MPKRVERALIIEMKKCKQSSTTGNFKKAYAIKTKGIKMKFLKEGKI